MEVEDTLTTELNARWLGVFDVHLKSPLISTEYTPKTTLGGLLLDLSAWLNATQIPDTSEN